MQSLDLTIPRGLFDGESKGHSPHRGIGVVFYLNASHYFHVQYALNRGSKITILISLDSSLFFFNKVLKNCRYWVIRRCYRSANQKKKVEVVHLKSILN